MKNPASIVSLAFAALTLFPYLTHATETTWATSLHDHLGAYYTWLAADCSAVYYLASSYRIDLTATRAAYVHDMSPSGADTEVRPRVRVTASLVPPASTPSPSEISQMRDWAARRCPRAPDVFRGYPSVFLELQPRRQIEDAIQPRVATATGDGHFQFVFDFDPLTLTSEQAILALRQYAPPARAAMFNLESDVAVRLTMSTAAVAEFRREQYRERTCTTRDECVRVFGLTLKCKTRHRCTDTPRDVQHLMALTTSHLAQIEILGAPHVPEAWIDEARAELMSRFALSSFTVESRQTIGTATEVRLGELKRSSAATYQDEESVDRVVTKHVDCPLRTEGLAEVLAPQVQRAFDNPVLRCLKASKGQVFLATNPCFKIKAEAL